MTKSGFVNEFAEERCKHIGKFVRNFAIVKFNNAFAFFDIDRNDITEIKHNFAYDFKIDLL